VKQEKTEDKNDEKKVQKDKKVEVKTVDKDGWVSREVRTLKSDGSVETDGEPEPEPEPETKKGKKAKKAQQQENKANQKNQKPGAASSSTKPVGNPAEEASKEFLDSNPFAAALREGSFQSVADSQFKRNMEKASEKPKPKQKQNQQQTQQQKGKAQAAPSKPKPAEQQSAPQKKQKAPQQVKAQKEAKKAMKVKPVVVAQSDWVVPAVVGAGVIIAIAVAYTVLIGA